jgi:hypothetical protein
MRPQISQIAQIALLLACGAWLLAALFAACVPADKTTNIYNVAGDDDAADDDASAEPDDDASPAPPTCQTVWDFLYITCKSGLYGNNNKMIPLATIIADCEAGWPNFDMGSCDAQCYTQHPDHTCGQVETCMSDCVGDPGRHR